MNKIDIINYVANDIAISKKDTRIIVDSLINSITKGIINDGKASIVNFGSFQVVKRAPRVARNPKTGERIDIPERMSLKFNMSDALKKIVTSLPKDK